MVTDFYLRLSDELLALTDGVPYRVSNFANAASLIYNSLDDVNWAGFYFMFDGALWLGPFMGRPACVTIALGRGVCGTAAMENRVLRVPDVHKFPGHIACDDASRSEIVLPLRDKKGRVTAVLDIDSPVTDRFSSDDEDGLRHIAEIAEKFM